MFHTYAKIRYDGKSWKFFRFEGELNKTLDLFFLFWHYNTFVCIW